MVRRKGSVMTRQEFTRKVRKHIIDRANGNCEACKLPFKPGARVEVDHILPCELGGTNDASNGRALCPSCHKAKTAEDIRRIRKADRQRDKASGAARKAPKMKSRGFENEPKPRAIDKAAVDDAAKLPRRRLFG